MSPISASFHCGCRTVWDILPMRKNVLFKQILCFCQMCFRSTCLFQSLSKKKYILLDQCCSFQIYLSDSNCLVSAGMHQLHIFLFSICSFYDFPLKVSLDLPHCVKQQRIMQLNFKHNFCDQDIGYQVYFVG